MPKFDPDKWIAQLMECQHLSEQEMKLLCDHVRSILLEESNIQPVSSPVTICGDIHGQFWDLLELLRKGGGVPETSYIFMARSMFYACLRPGEVAARPPLPFWLTLTPHFRVILLIEGIIVWRQCHCCLP